MRISTKSIYETGSTQINTLQSALNRSQMQLSTNRRNLTPADDPIATARALEVTQSQSINTQLVTNRSNAKNFLTQEDQALSNATQLVSDVQELVIKAGNGTYTDLERGMLATELKGRLNDMLAVANSSDGAGGYLFAGFKSGTQPFSPNSGGATYLGDQGQRELQVGSSRQIPTSDAGSTVFENNMTGNGSFVTAAAAGNYGRGGAATIGPGTVSNVAALTGHNYSIDFTVAAGVTSYVVTDTTLGVTVPSPAAPAAYTSGQTIGFDGQQFDITGVPANGDQFTVAPSSRESIFTTLTNLLGVMSAPGSGPAGQARLSNGLTAVHSVLDSAYDNMLAVRADVGARLKELDYLDSSGADKELQYAQTLSDLQDLDVAKTISLFTQQQTTLQAAQKSFSSMSGLSLFNYIS